MAQQHILIVGAGWLGLPLAEALQNDGYRVTATVSSSAKLPALTNARIKGHVLNVVQGTRVPALPAADIMVVTIPPRGTEEASMGILKQLADAAKRGGIPKVIYCSSTSVYPDLNREVVVADAAEVPSGQNRVRVLRLEQVFAANPVFQTTVLRLGGLFGNGRHPANALKPGRVMQGPENPVNMAHLDDCIAAVRAVIEEDAFPEVRNVVRPIDQTRREFYAEACIELGLPEPEWGSDAVAWKKVRAYAPSVPSVPAI